jgi:hypothetical protein
MDSSAVGNLVASYPLKIYKPEDERIKNTVNYMLEKDFLHGLFFHEIAHSGLNIYLSLQVAQVLLRSGTPGYFDIMKAASEIASGTGQWPEAIHPWTDGGCMGDGQQLWASVEWIMIIRNCFVREENEKLILCSGISEQWNNEGGSFFFGPSPTPFGQVSISVRRHGNETRVDIEGDWRVSTPEVEIRMPGYDPVKLKDGEKSVILHKGGF